MEPPPELKRGPRLVREAFNALRLWAISQRPLPSLDCDVHDSPQGRIILPKPSGVGGQSVERNQYPFEIVVKDTILREVWIRYGTCGGLVPTINGVELTAALDEDAPVLTIGGSGEHPYLELNTDSYGDPTSVAIKSFTDEIPEDTDTMFNLEIGIVQCEEGKITAVANAIQNSIAFTRCRDWFETPPTYSANWSSL